MILALGAFLLSPAVLGQEGPVPSPLDLGPEPKGALSPDGRTFALSAAEGGVFLLYLSESVPVDRIQAPAGMHLAENRIPPRHLEWSPDGHQLAWLLSDGRLEVVEAASASLRASLATYVVTVEPAWQARHFRFAAGGERIVVACGGGIGEIWSVGEGSLMARIGPQGSNPATALAVSRGGERVALGDLQGFIAVWSASSGVLVAGPISVGAKINWLDFDPTGELLAIGARDCKVKLWDTTGGQPMQELSHCDQDLFGGLEIGWVQFSPDGRRLLATSSSFWEARVWDLATSAETWRYDYRGGNPGFLAGAFSPDGSRVVLSLRGVVLDVPSGKVCHELVSGRELRPWFQSEGDLAWTVWDDRLLVCSTADGRRILDLPVMTSGTR